MRMPLTGALGAALMLAACGGGDGNAAGAGNAAAPEREAGQARSTIGDALGGMADHAALVQALQSSGLMETLRGAGPYTLFAPTDAAFEAIPAEARAGLADPERREQLIQLLSFHVVPGTVTGADLERAIARAPGGRAELATVTGRNLSVFREGDTLVVSDGAEGRARIVRADQSQTNGVVHSIDAVLMPGGE